MHRMSQVHILTLNESPSEKEGKCACCAFILQALFALNESPSEKEGKCEEQF